MTQSFDRAFANVAKQRFSLLDGQCEIVRTHNRGWPFSHPHFIYKVTGSKRTLTELLLCDEAWFPTGRKRTSFSTQEGWALKAESIGWTATFRTEAVERCRRVEIYINCCQTLAYCDARKDRAFQAFLQRAMT